MAREAPTAPKFRVTQKILSTHFSVKEAIRSQTAERLGIDNSIPDLLTLTTMINTANGMENVRTVLDDKPVRVSSWLRVLELNRALLSKDSSQHPKGEAVDFDCDEYGTPLQICRAIIASGMSFDQLILEHSWVHISFKNPSGKNRRQVLTLLKSGKYAVGLTNKFGKEYK